MRYITALIVAFAFFVVARAASAQPQQQIRVPYEVCAGTTQSQLCEALALLRQQQAASTVVAVAPLGAPPAVAAAVRPPPPRCHSGPRGDECRCRNRGGLMQDGRCVSTRAVVAQVAGDTRDLTTRMTAAERAIQELRTSQATTDRRVSENTAGLNCLEVILLPNVGVDPSAARQRATEEHAAALGRTHGAYCADFYRVAYGLPTPRPTQMVTAPTPPPAPQAPPASAHVSAPAAEGPITVTFQ